MTLIDQIKAAWNMGYAAKLIRVDAPYNYVVLGMEGYSGIILRDEGKIIESWVSRSEDGLELKESLKITGYIYAGELAGNAIPEGQRFRVKGTGEIFPYTKGINKKLSRVFLLVPFTHGIDKCEYDKSELEPIFD